MKPRFVETANRTAALETWAQDVIRRQVERAGEALAGYCKKPRSAKRLHAARKQLARLRAALDDLGPLAGVTPDFRERVHELHKRAGKVRDADVLRGRVGEYSEDAFGRECRQLEAVDDRLRTCRKKARRKLAGVVAETSSELRP